METTTRPRVVHSAMNDIKKKKISFKHKLQRREGVWTKKQKSLLIDSLLKHYPTNPIYLVVEEGEPKRVIDGLQRLSTIKSYVNDEFTLSTLDNIEIDGVPRKLSGKKFSELDPAVKEEISSAEIVLCELRDATDKDIIELFSRINNGKPLNSTQKLTTFMSVELIDIISSMVENLFFNNVDTRIGKDFGNPSKKNVFIDVGVIKKIQEDPSYYLEAKLDLQQIIEHYDEARTHGGSDLPYTTGELDYENGRIQAGWRYDSKCCQEAVAKEVKKLESPKLSDAINYDYIKDKMDTMLDDFMDKVTEGIVGEDKEEG